MVLSLQGNQVKADLVYGLKVENNYQVVKIEQGELNKKNGSD